MVCERQAVTSQNSWAGILHRAYGFSNVTKRERCLFVHESNETRVVSHVVDNLICAKPATLEHSGCRSRSGS